MAIDVQAHGRGVILGRLALMTMARDTRFTAEQQTRAQQALHDFPTLESPLPAHVHGTMLDALRFYLREMDEAYHAALLAGEEVGARS